ncbi:DUF4238 domain-containing protein [Xylophilus sp. GOD-11R]|uniref:DUF4238 domain-containing protein n=1 Tax=Xylophilus sp. GOD-11R TaxID=3089814 RepID=UPI00298CCA20|nr:DUF4238 domain-containing protein [Xylophilus sp. GOD-11R]WPB58627.1 DUF4238 domain-containing protein [Xylophilus sp. GOD-11R]
MPDGKNQHFVPQRYFRKFSADGKSISLFQKHTSRFIRAASIKHQASKAWFYGDEEIEKAVTALESVGGSAIDKILSASDLCELDDETFDGMRLWLALQRHRTEAARSASASVDNDLLHLYLESKLHIMEEQGPYSRAELAAVIPKLEVIPAQAQLTKIGIGVEQSHNLDDLAVVVLKNKSTKPFIFSDAPCVYHNVFYEKVKGVGVLGARSVGLLIFLPLSPAKCLMVYDSNVYSINPPPTFIKTVGNIADISAINSLQMHSASSCIYASNHLDEGYVRYLWDTQKDRVKDNSFVTRKFSSFDSNNRPSSELRLYYEPVLNIQFRLSFMKTQKSPAGVFFRSRDEFMNGRT